MTSRSVDSNQPGIHPRLTEVVERHLNHPFLRPIPDYSRRAFEQVFGLIDDFNGPLVFDSFCGVGESTAHTALALPEALVIGIDKSAARLGKHDAHYRQRQVDNYLLVRADVDDFWRQALQAGWRLHRHQLFYPNPWPKSAQLQRRCHGSPLFPTLLRLGGELELRSNWRLYLEEFAAALAIAGRPSVIEQWQPSLPVTPFERKYQQAGQPLWRLTSRPNFRV